MVPYLRAVFKPSYKVNKLGGRIRLASAKQVVELHPPAHPPAPTVRSYLCRGFTLSGEARKGAKEGQDELVGFLRGERQGNFGSGMVRIIERGLLHLGVQIDHRQRAVFHRIAGAELDAVLKRAREHRAVKSAVAHRLFAALTQLVRVHVGFFVGGEINRILFAEAVMGGQGGEPLT
jgi:hypothetical protein